MLYASLAASILSLFVATLCKLWLNHYASVDMQASAIERSMNRQRKLDNLNTWHFHHVVQLPWLMLQVALFLLICAFFRYLWAADTILVWTVPGLTASIFSFFFLIIALGRSS